MYQLPFPAGQWLDISMRKSGKIINKEKNKRKTFYKKLAII